MARCIMCRAKNARACARCKSTVYCSKECQKLDWPTHKTLCRARAELSPRPSEQHVLGIYFPEFEPKPRLVWVKVLPASKELLKGLDEEEMHPLGVATTIPQTKSYLGEDAALWGLDDDAYKEQTGLSPFHDRDYLCVNPRNGAGTSKRHLCITGLANSVHCQYPMSLAGLVPWPAKQWRGPVVCLAVRLGEGLPEVGHFTDATLADFRMVLDTAMCWPSDGVVFTTRMDDSGDEDDDSEDGDTEDADTEDADTEKDDTEEDDAEVEAEKEASK